ASTATIRPMIPSSELPPPPSEDFASMTGAGVSEDSSPDQSTTLPSEDVCRTENVKCLVEFGVGRNEKAASSPVGTWPPSQVTFVTTASSPEPCCCTVRFQPGEGTNESIANPLGGVISTLVVNTPS